MKIDAKTITSLARVMAKRLKLEDWQTATCVRVLDKELPIAMAKNPNVLSHMLYQQEPRNDALAEKGLIGRILSYPNEVLPNCSGMTYEYFYKQHFGEIFKVCQQLQDENKPVTLDVVASKIGIDTLNEWGGVSWLKSLTVGLGKNVEAAETLKERVVNAYMLRHAWAIMNNAITATYECPIEDATELVEKIKSELSLEGVKDNVSDSSSLVEKMKEKLALTIERVKAGILFPGREIYLKSLNDLFGGWEDGKLVIKCGRPGMGKTAEALQDMLHACFDLKEVAVFFSLEMEEIELTERLFFKRSMITKKQWSEGLKSKYHQEQFGDFMKELEESDLYIDDTPGATWQHIRDRCLRLKNKHGKLDRVYIDYIQLMGALEGQTRAEELNSITRNLKSLSACSFSLSAVSVKMAAICSKPSFLAWEEK